jgi:uncharacterized protein YukE
MALDFFQMIPDQAQDLLGQINSNGKKWDDQVSHLKQQFTTITPGIWEGNGAAAFGQFVLTQYIPAAMDLVAAIAGLGGGFSQAFDVFKMADQNCFSSVSDLVGDFNFF